MKPIRTACAALALAVAAVLSGCRYVEKYNPFDKEAESTATGVNDPVTPVDPGGEVDAPTGEAPAAAGDAGDAAAPAAAGAPPVQLYTTYNIWYENQDRLESINYKAGAFIPAGTPVRGVGLADRRFRADQIVFTLVESNITFKVGFNAKYHPGKSIHDHMNRMFTDKPLDQLTEGLEPHEIDAIKKGVLVPGMSRRAVLIAYGYPPEHATISLEQSPWTYWMNRFTKKMVYFDEGGRTIPPPPGAGL